MQDRLQRVEGFSRRPQGLAKRGQPQGQHHKLLDINVVIGVLASIEDVKHRYWQRVLLPIGEPTVKRNIVVRGRRSCRGNRDAEQRVGPKPAFVGCSVQLNKFVVERRLIGSIQATDRF